MKKIIYFTVSLFVFILFYSCDKEIEFKGEVQEPMLVMNGVVTANEKIVLRLTESQFFLNVQDYYYKFIKDADVTLFVNDEFVETFQYKERIFGESNVGQAPPLIDYEYENPGAYVAEYLPKVGDHIRIEAKHPNFNTAEASLIIPNAPIVLSADTLDRKLIEYPITSFRHDEENDYELITDTLGIVEMEQFKLRVQFNDPAAVRNFYRIGLTVLEKPEGVGFFNEMIVPLLGIKDLEGEHIWAKYLYTVNDLVFNQNTPELGSLVDEDGEVMSTNPYLIFDDALFDGESYVLNLIVLRQIEKRYFDEWIDFDHSEPVEEVILKFTLTEMTKEYHHYLQLVTAHKNYSPLFSEPIQILNNVKGGIGIIGGETHAEIHIQLK